MIKSKKAFTIVEVVIVIAVIAILAATLIPTFQNVVKKAKYSNDQQVCRNMNTSLASEYVTTTPSNIIEVQDKLKENGFGNSFTPVSKEYHYYWYSVNNHIYLVNDEDDKFVVYFPEDEEEINVSKTNSYRLDKEYNPADFDMRKTQSAPSTGILYYEMSNEGFVWTLIWVDQQEPPRTPVSAPSGHGALEYAVMEFSDMQDADGKIANVKAEDLTWQDSNIFNYEEDPSTYFYGFARFKGDSEYQPSEIVKVAIGFFCFVAGTKISMADGTFKNIEDIVVGDKVLSYDTVNQEFYETVVLKTFEHVSTSIATITLEDGTKIECTLSHPLLTTDGFKSVNPNYSDVMKEYRSSDLKVGDFVITQNGITEVIAISVEAATVPVFNFHVKSNGGVENSTYIANGAVVHNACGD